VTILEPPEDEETYHLLVSPRLEEHLKNLGQPARDPRLEEPERRDAPQICPTCRSDLEALGLPAAVTRCGHAR